MIERLLEKKKSDSIVVLGSGYSINSITKDQWNKIKEVDSIGFNWFCKSRFVPSFYLVREQATIPARVSSTETPQILIKTLTSNRYKNCLIIVLDLSSHSPRSYSYANKIKNAIVFKDRKKKSGLKAKYCQRNIESFGVFHGFSTMTSILHLIATMGYKKVYFAGVDLKDSRYFWLQKNEARHTIRAKKKKANQTHPIAKRTIKFVRRIDRLFPDVEFYTLNKNSLLVNILQVAEYGDLCA